MVTAAELHRTERCQCEKRKPQVEQKASQTGRGSEMSKAKQAPKNKVLHEGCKREILSWLKSQGVVVLKRGGNT